VINLQPGLYRRRGPQSMTMSFSQVIVVGLVAIWSAAFLIAVVSAVCSNDADKRADARRVVHLLRSPWPWIAPRGWFAPEDDTAQ
jgi:hypothetical protein